MAPKKKAEEEPPPAEESEDEPAEPEIFQKCLRTSGQLYYGDCKAGYKKRKGRYIRHGFGWQVCSAVSPLGQGPNGLPAFETLVLSTYEGNWEEDTPAGHGTFKWSDGSCYEGDVQEGKMHGHGRFKWPDGSTYEGTWQEGLMHGQGRFDSRFDGGRYMQGHFHQNCFQKSDGRWVEVLQHLRNHERKQVLEGNPLQAAVEEAANGATAGNRKTKKGPPAVANAASIFRCAPGARGTAPGRTKTLGNVLEEVLNDNLVPLVLADESASSSALEAFLAAGAVVDPATQCVSMRLAAVQQGRQRDFKRYFRDALQSSLLAGSYFALVFEDDEGAAELSQDSEADWVQRSPTAIGISALPEEWRLASFFDDSSLPPDVFCPVLFSARGRARRFLPDEVAANSGSEVPLAPQGSAPQEPAEVAAEESAAAGAAVEEAARAAAAAKEMATKAAAKMPPTGLGSTGHIFELSPEESSSRSETDTTALLGMPLVHKVRPALVTTARLPDGLEDDQVQNWVKQRFSRHLPVHRVAVVVVGQEPSMEQTAWPGGPGRLSRAGSTAPSP